MLGIGKGQAPPGQTCLGKSILSGWNRLQMDQLVILWGMNPAFKFVRIIARKLDSGKLFTNQFYQP
jgi:hypothetical protein